MSAILEVKSEVAYDLMHDHLDTILALLDRPMTRDEVLLRVGTPATLDRMVRYGLVANDGTELRAVASVYHQLRQEGMTSFLEHYVLPGLTADASAPSAATLDGRYLTLDPGTARGLRHGRVQRLYDELTKVSELESTGPLSRLTVMVIGTSRVIRDTLDPEESALRHLQQAAVQRATPAERDCAVLSQYVFLADPNRVKAAHPAIQQFVQSLESERASSITEATYHLTVATHWRSATPMCHDGAGQ